MSPLPGSPGLQWSWLMGPGVGHAPSSGSRHAVPLQWSAAGHSWSMGGPGAVMLALWNREGGTEWQVWCFPSCDPQTSHLGLRSIRGQRLSQTVGWERQTHLTAEHDVGQPWPYSNARQDFLDGKSKDHYETLCQSEVPFKCKTAKFQALAFIEPSTKHLFPAPSPCTHSSVLCHRTPYLRLPSRSLCHSGMAAFYF